MRLFIAIDLSDDMKKSLLEYQDGLRSCGVTGNYSPEENLHLTLAFIGEYGDPGAVISAMEQVDFGSFRLVTSGIGSFSDTLWAGTVREQKLEKLVRDLRRSLSDAGIPFDRKKFRPHITLVRRAAFPRGSADMMPELRSSAMEADGITLFRSDRGKKGMIYTEIGYVSADRQEN
jgi:2'-5' RNA ligase